MENVTVTTGMNVSMFLGWVECLLEHIFFVLLFYSCLCTGDKDDENKVKMTKGQKQKFLYIFPIFSISGMTKLTLTLTF